MEQLLKAVSVARVYGHGSAAVEALKDVNLEVMRNRLVALKGRSGSGKTTLMNLLGALDSPSRGKVIFEGHEISSLTEAQRSEIRRQRMGFIFQSFALVPYLSAAENVEFALRVASVPKAEWSERVADALDRVGLTKRAKHRPHEMSGGEQQRCAIARAMAHRPTLILADEPTAELDSRMGLQVMNVFRELVRDMDVTVVMATHDPAIMEVADHVFTLENGEIVDEAI